LKVKVKNIGTRSFYQYNSGICVTTFAYNKEKPATKLKLLF